MSHRERINFNLTKFTMTTNIVDKIKLFLIELINYTTERYVIQSIVVKNMIKTGRNSTNR